VDRRRGKGTFQATLADLLDGAMFVSDETTLLKRGVFRHSTLRPKVAVEGSSKRHIRLPSHSRRHGEKKGMHVMVVMSCRVHHLSPFHID